MRILCYELCADWSRFLWVYLQLEILWDTCHTDAEIRSALAALPKGLEETYGRCVERINFQDSRVLKVLKWVSFATSPLHIEELREVVAFDLGDTAWNAEKIPRKEFVIGCCANLVVVDSTDNCVRFAHSSVKQYLENDQERSVQERSIPGYPTTAQGELECGEFCVAYLSFSDFSLQLSTQRNATVAITVPPPILLAQETLPGFFARRFFQKPRKQTRSFPFHRIRTASTPDRIKYKFLDYAVTNWALQTKQIPHTSLIWEKFEQLAMCFNETWNFHPWVPDGRSASSHLHSLFGWAVKEQHEPLLSIAQATGPSLCFICDLPLNDESLPALHVASKLGYKSITSILLDFCKVDVLDQEGYTALHHAASRGHIDIIRLLSNAKGVKVDATSKSHCTPLWLAASNGHEEVVSLLMEKQANIEAKDANLHHTPLSQAARNGHYAVVELLLGKRADLESQDTDGRTPLSWAVKGWHEAVMKLLLEKGAKTDSKDIDTEALRLWAVEKGYEAIVELLTPSGHLRFLPGSIKRSNISGPVQLISTTNMLAYNAPDIHFSNSSSTS
jgi:FOG: Ankyrin repeat